MTQAEEELLIAALETAVKAAFDIVKAARSGSIKVGDAINALGALSAGEAADDAAALAAAHARFDTGGGT